MLSGESASPKTVREILDIQRAPLDHAEVYDGSGTWKAEYMPSSGDESLADKEASVHTITAIGCTSVSAEMQYPHSA